MKVHGTFSSLGIVAFLLCCQFVSGTRPWAGDHGYGIYLEDIDGRHLDSENMFPSFYHGDGDSWTIEFWFQKETASTEDGNTFRLIDSDFDGLFNIGTDISQSTITVYSIAAGTLRPEANMDPETGDTSAAHVAFACQKTGANTRVDFFYNGVHHGSDTRAGWAEPGVNGLSNSLRIRFWQSNIPIPNSGYENLRIWRGVRTEEQIRDNMHRILNKEDHPTLDCDFRFDEDITSTTFYDNYGHDSQGIGRIEVIGTSEGYATKSMRIASGQGLDSFTNITMLSDPAVSFELPMKGGDADGDAITFELTSHSPELTIINDDLTTDLPYFEARPTSDIDEPLTVFYEYRTLAGGQVSLRTRTYLELLPLNPGPGDDDDANPGSSNPFVYVGLGSFLALLIFGGLVGRAKTNNGDDEALLEGGAKGQGTAGGAIAVLLDKFSVSELNLYVTHMLSKGNYDSALALALSVEQKAVGGAATDYLQAVDNVGAALFYCGFTDAIAPVKQARRTTMGMKGKVRQSQLVGKQIGNAKSAVKRKTLLKKPQDDVFEVQTVAMSLKNPTGKAPPVSVWMDGKDSGKKQGKKNGKKR